MFYTYRKVLIIAGMVFCLFSSIFAYSGGSGEPNDPYQIATVSDWNDLMNTSSDWNKNFIMTADVNLQGVALTPVGDYNGSSGTPFTGVFDGNGHIIRNAKINMPDDYCVGLFGHVGPSGNIRNLGVEDININGIGYVGGLVGWNYEGTISNCYTTGLVTINSDSDCVGGLVGLNGGSINNCYSTGAVSGGSWVGGLVGYNYQGSISNCYSIGVIDGNDNTGGLCGSNEDGSITSCYSTGTVSGDYGTGGLCGYNYKASITNCYSTGNVTGNTGTGGLCGVNEEGSINGSITDCYSTGNVTGGGYDTGGLCGYNGGNITNCYSTGSVSGDDEYTGGLCGANSGSIISCYFLDTAGLDNGLGEPLTDEQMKQQASFIDWDFSYTDGDSADWFIQIDEYPILTWQISPADIYTDGRNNFRDFAIFAQYWMRNDCAIYNNYCDWADLDFNGSVDVDDLIEFMSYWLQSGIYE